jgi:hypothetical protein
VLPQVNVVQRNSSEYQAGRVPRLLSVAPARYLVLPGGGDEFLARAALLHRVAGALRQRAAREYGKDFALPPLEAQWWGGGDEAPVGQGVACRLLLRMPTFVAARDLAAVAGDIGSPGEPGSTPAVRLEELREGRCMQLLWLGGPETAPAVLERLRAEVADQGLAPRGRLHAIYLSDPARVTPGRQRAILRHPVRPR